ncbi:MULTISPECIES: alpha/beta hydrolase [unclassified Rhizobium]|uniref:alpha/beta hydrolase n=1 Tax=unclassified Rhizobium TaxID=2613769 RepID=UPI001AE96018|nr:MULTISPECIES: alpha/beta hydrolase [unclassified Rhizobium]MBP2463690.1 pimeloyl-ACP methyl ester carboxylesterase [Rhizobium sp. PvP014]MBP2532211.1 pimeloyl-ACP methyl ester carboxylesterase [Rhizobium sp. PvP099]
MTMKRLLAGALLALAISGPAKADGTAKVAGSVNAGATNVVLVHGGTTDGSGWKDVFQILRAKGLAVTVVELPHTSLEDDIAATNLAVATQSGPTVLVGHSYGGAVITEAGIAPNVKALVYVAALQPDKGETLLEISSRFPMGIDMKKLDDDKRFVPNPATYHEMIGADLPRDVTDFMSAMSKPMRLDTFQIPFQHAAWHDKPSFGIVTTEDKVLSSDFLQWMYKRSGTKMTEVKSSHMVYMSHPQETADVILEAASSVK